MAVAEGTARHKMATAAYLPSQNKAPCTTVAAAQEFLAPFDLMGKKLHKYVTGLFLRYSITKENFLSEELNNSG